MGATPMIKVKQPDLLKCYWPNTNHARSGSNSKQLSNQQQQKQNQHLRTDVSQATDQNKLIKYRDET